MLGPNVQYIFYVSLNVAHVIASDATDRTSTLLGSEGK